MSQTVMNLLSGGVFGGSILLIIYLVYREFMLNRAKAENATIALGEKENEDMVNSQSDVDLINSVNKEFGSTNSSPSAKPSGSLPGGSSSDGDSKATPDKKS